MADHGDGNIKVIPDALTRSAVSSESCRSHILGRELARGAKNLIRMQGNQTFLDPPDKEDTSAGRATEKKTMSFSFDKSYWSAGPRDEPQYASQQTLYNDLGQELLEHGFAGFNACILTYGQTGSGKSYSMMGYGADKGIIPLTCEELFSRVGQKTGADPNLSISVEVSYIEIYNEKVRDLLNPKNKSNLKVREHPSLGPYVEDLSKLMVASYDEMMTLMDEGNKARTVAATQMNETSSRSHAVFTLVLTQKRHDSDTNLDTEKVSRISLVDLAGSERANSTGATGARLKEGANINKSLTTLGKVISALAAQSADTGKKSKKGAGEFIPYRDSVLTYLLKDSIGGNSKTAMIAAISPADYDETLSTLRYADQAKKIKNKAVVNEDPNAKLVRELKEELEMLRARVAGGAVGGGSVGEATFDVNIPAAKQMVTYQTKDGTTKTVSKADLQEQLESREKLMESLNETWEQKMERTQEIQKEREQALEELGITVDKNNVGVHTPKKMPHLVNLNEDPLMSECLVYQLKTGRTMVGFLENAGAAVRLSGNISHEHCYIDNVDDIVTIHALPGAVTLVNGKQLEPDHPMKLRSGFRIILGESQVFRFNNPVEVRKQRDRHKSHLRNVTNATPDTPESEEFTRPPSPSGSDVDFDWTFAQREAALARLHGLDPGLDSLPDEDLNKLFDRITKLKTSRDAREQSVRLGRPESSMSGTGGVEDMWSEYGRAPDGFTDDTSVANGNEGDSVSVIQAQLDAQKQDFEARLDAIHESAEAEDLKVEKEYMETQLKLVQNQMKRLLDVRARGETPDLTPFEPTIYTARQLRLIRKVLEQWRAHRSFSMSESVLSNAVFIKEANVISKALNKPVSYNFTIAGGGPLASPVSQLHAGSGLGGFGDVSDSTIVSNTRPTVAVKVLDKRNQAVYLWSLDRFQQQLQKMRNLTAFIDRPTYSQHFASDEPFFESPPPEYSFIGNSLVSLACLSRKLSSTATLPIFCRYTAEAIGSCRVDIRVQNTAPPLRSPPSSAAPTRSSSPVPSSLPNGTTLTFFLTVDSVKGLSSHDFSSIHLQLRLSSFGGSTIETEEVFASNAPDLDTSIAGDLRFRRKFNLVVNPKVLRHLKDGYAPIEFFAIVKPDYLTRLERWDEMREQQMAAPCNGVADPDGSFGSDDSESSPQPMRRSETDFVAQETHDVVAWVQVTELASSGDYQPVQVLSQGSLDPGVFTLHQGLQRRVLLTLTSNSGRQLPWTLVPRLRLGNVRLLDAKGRIHETTSKDVIDLKLLRQLPVENHPDGTCTIGVEALWDSGAHDSYLLNRVTAANHRVLLQMQWAVDIDTCQDPAMFSMDIAVAVQNRDARPPNRLLTLLSSTKTLSKSSTVFTLRLNPPLTRSPKDLWRMDTSEKYVRGEESLGSWKARGLSVVEDFLRLDTAQHRAADVNAVKTVLASISAAPSHRSGTSPTSRDPDALAQKVLGAWPRGPQQSGHALLNGGPDPAPVSKLLPTEPVKLVAVAKIAQRSDGATKRGHLMVLIDAAENKWEKRWFSLQRPHLYMYAHSNELEEVGVISLSDSSVKVEHTAQMDALFDRKFTFTLFTPSNSHAFAAPNLKEMQTWLLKIDPTYIPPTN
ncbi:kinesin-like protein [Clavulina sp. PMI_390]|nr:kinesin-like protein [Clavulina sp. PMI_390]